MVRNVKLIIITPGFYVSLCCLSVSELNHSSGATIQCSIVSHVSVYMLLFQFHLSPEVCLPRLPVINYGKQVFLKYRRDSFNSCPDTSRQDIDDSFNVCPVPETELKYIMLDPAYNFFPLTEKKDKKKK